LFNNDLTAMEGVTEVPFKFEYDSTSGKYGYRDGADTFRPFNDGEGGSFPIHDELVGHTARVYGNYKNISVYFDGQLIASSSKNEYVSMTLTIKSNNNSYFDGGYKLTGTISGLGNTNISANISLNGTSIKYVTASNYSTIDTGNFLLG